MDNDIWFLLANNRLSDMGKENLKNYVEKLEKENEQLKSKIQKALEDIDLLMSGRYVKYSTQYMQSHCCNLRLDIIKEDLENGSDSQ